VVLDYPGSTTTNAQDPQKRSGKAAAPPTPRVEEQAPGSLKRQREGFDSYKASNAGFGDPDPESKNEF
jgi:hypothetical protein